MFRWPAPVMDLYLPPEEQPGSEQLVQQVLDAFAWFNRVRTVLTR